MKFKEASARVSKEEDYLIDVLRRLIAVDTTIPPGENYGLLLDLVEPELRRFGFATQRIYVPEEKYRQIPEPLQGERPNMVAVMRNGRPRASYYAHMDVVPIDEPWTMDPFAGVIKNGKFYGRGAVDMKGAIACFLGAAKVLYEMGLEPLFDLECLFCTDEEVGVYPGARYLAEEGYFSNHLVWGEFGTLEPVVIIGTAGALRVDLTAIGKSCHSGMNWMGVNSIEEMVPILQELMTLKKEVEKRLSRIPAFPMPGNPYDKMSPMFNLNVIRGGRKDNVVPGDCTLTINRRYIPDEVYEDVVSEIEAAVKRGREKTKLLDLKVIYTNCFPPVQIDPENPASKKMRAAASAVLGFKDFVYGGMSASTDMGFVLEAMKPQKVDVACFGMFRAKENKAHAADEYVFVEDLIKMTQELVHYFAF